MVNRTWVLFLTTMSGFMYREWPVIPYADIPTGLLPEHCANRILPLVFLLPQISGNYLTNEAGL